MADIERALYCWRLVSTICICHKDFLDFKTSFSIHLHCEEFKKERFLLAMYICAYVVLYAHAGFIIVTVNTVVHSYYPNKLLITFVCLQSKVTHKLTTYIIMAN